MEQKCIDELRSVWDIKKRFKSHFREKLQQSESTNDALTKENLFLKTKIEHLMSRLNDLDARNRCRTMSAGESSPKPPLQRRAALIAQSGDIEIKGN